MTAMQRNKGAYTVRLPIPPSANSMWRNVNGRTLLSKKYRQWRGEARWGPDSKWPAVAGLPVFEGPVSVDITLKRPRKNADLDNRIKPILDVLEDAQIFENDNQVAKLSIRWGDVEGAEVRVERLMRGGRV